jgi:catechol 2,3-dioxygenase-like lactoylglutathione lyase family enzyme
MSVALFAGLRVRDLDLAQPWYERLLGAPSSFPNETEVVWTLAEGRHVYIEEDPQLAGDGLVTVFVEDLEAVLSEIAGRGLEPAHHETYDNGVHKAVFVDPDGNQIGYGGAP